MREHTQSIIAFIIVAALVVFFTFGSAYFWPKTEVSMTVDHFPYCFYFDVKKEITCYNKAVTTKYVKDAYHIVFEKANTFNEKGE